MRVSSKGQICLPKKVREALGLKPGDLVEIETGTDFAIIRPVKKPSESLRGIGRHIKEKLGLGAVELVRQLREEET
jgi:AbrB family looped-hinge helix DNA binding protein